MNLYFLFFQTGVIRSCLFAIFIFLRWFHRELWITDLVLSCRFPLALVKNSSRALRSQPWHANQGPPLPQGSSLFPWRGLGGSGRGVEGGGGGVNGDRQGPEETPAVVREVLEQRDHHRRYRRYIVWTSVENMPCACARYPENVFLLYLFCFCWCY